MVQGCMLVIQKKSDNANCNKRELRCHNIYIECRINNISVCEGHTEMLEDYLNIFMDLEVMWKKDHGISLESVFSMAKDEALIEHINKIVDDKQKKNLLSIINIIDILNTQL
jgi:hypothetical protein